jgi:hypothetical protein
MKMLSGVAAQASRARLLRSSQRPSLQMLDAFLKWKESTIDSQMSRQRVRVFATAIRCTQSIWSRLQRRSPTHLHHHVFRDWLGARREYDASYPHRSRRRGSNELGELSCGNAAVDVENPEPLGVARGSLFQPSRCPEPLHLVNWSNIVQSHRVL